ncbi:hypothetical protein ACH5RR_012693 [Cinchona calisaya]|uniref:Uncharacterized protein n=1 Tax=Cinchona calisaya TaxID=153742 RepID=A0ABD3AB45_9GENT
MPVIIPVRNLDTGIIINKVYDLAHHATTLLTTPELLVTNSTDNIPFALGMPTFLFDLNYSKIGVDFYWPHIQSSIELIFIFEMHYLAELHVSVIPQDHLQKLEAEKLRLELGSLKAELAHMDFRLSLQGVNDFLSSAALASNLTNLCQEVHRLGFKDALYFVNKEHLDSLITWSRSEWYVPLVSKESVGSLGDFSESLDQNNMFFRVCDKVDRLRLLSKGSPPRSNACIFLTYVLSSSGNFWFIHKWLSNCCKLEFTSGKLKGWPSWMLDLADKRVSEKEKSIDMNMKLAI